MKYSVGQLLLRYNAIATSAGVPYGRDGESGGAYAQYCMGELLLRGALQLISAEL